MVKTVPSGSHLVTHPGHSPCSLSVVLDSGEAIIGGILAGTLFAQQKPAFHGFITNEKELIKSLTTLLDTQTKLFYTGHGGPFIREDIEKLFSKEHSQTTVRTNKK